MAPKRQERRVRPEDPAYVEALKEVFPLKGYIDGAENRGITHSQLHRVISYSLDKCSEWYDLNPMSALKGQTLASELLNLYHVNSWMILPATRDADCSCVELLTGSVQKPNWFISHWWGEKVVEFMECVGAHINTRILKANTTFWVCAYANRQHSLHTDITIDPRDSSFYKAMKMAEGILLVLDGKVQGDAASGPATPFTRIWCAFEVSMAILHLKKHLDIAGCEEAPQLEGAPRQLAAVLTEGLNHKEEEMDSKNPGWGYRRKVKRESAFPVSIMDTGLDVNVERADASVELDRIRILNCIAESETLEEKPPQNNPNYAKVNLQLRSHFAVAMWFQAVLTDSVNVERLAEALLADTWRTSLVMNMGFCPKFDDKHLSVLSQGIPPQLTSLELHFWMCESISNYGIEVLSKALPASLETLILNFQMCSNVGSAGVMAIGNSLPTGLKVLRLSFEWNKSILSIQGLTDGIALLQSLFVLDLDFGQIDQLDNREVVALAKILPRKLKNLSLSLQLCTRLENSGAIAIAEHLPENVTMLNLNFKGCEQLTNKGVDAIAGHLPPELLAFHMNLEDCSHIGEASIARFVSRLPESLYGAKINLAGTAVSDQKCVICRRLDRMREWMPPVEKRKASIQSSKAGDDKHAGGLRMEVIQRLRSQAKAAASPQASSMGASGSGHDEAATLSPSASRRPRGRPVIQEETALVDGSRASLRMKRAISCPALKSLKPLKPFISRPVQPPASVYWTTSPDAMFSRPRTLFNGLTEPLWLP